jgi:hypothetical protein
MCGALVEGHPAKVVAVCRKHDRFVAERAIVPHIPALDTAVPALAQQAAAIREERDLHHACVMGVSLSLH